jgi:cytoskeletal protein RodZ
MADFGGKLRQARERRGVSLRQVSSATKISLGVLEALERNDVSKLPGGIFSRAFVRSYASEVGLDPDETIRDFVSEFSKEDAAAVQSAPPVPPPAAPRASDADRAATRFAPQPARRTKPAVEIVPDESEFESQQRMATVVLRLVMVSVPLVLVILYFSLRGPAAIDADASRPSRPAPEAAPPPAPMDATVAPVGAATAGREPTPVSSPPPIPSVSADQQTIELRPGAPCWVSLTVDGASSFTREMQAGERVVRTFREEAILKVGDGAACEFALNGRIARPLGGPGQARTIKITPQNVASYLP